MLAINLLAAQAVAINEEKKTIKKILNVDHIIKIYY